MSANAPQPPGVEVWRAQYMRLIAFPAQPAFTIQQDWWAELTGSEPEESTERRQRQERDASGMYDGVSLALNIDLLRVQWTVQPRIAIPDGLEAAPTIGPFVDRRDWFIPLMQRWLETCPPINRLAFVSSVHQPVADKADGYRRLDQYLRCVDVDPESSDILYRINRRRPSATGVTGLAVNRLSSWAVGTFAVRLQASAGGGEGQTRQTESVICVADLDINTAPDFPGPLPHDRLGAIFAELAAFGTEIASRGDARL